MTSSEMMCVFANIVSRIFNKSVANIKNNSD